MMSAHMSAFGGEAGMAAAPSRPRAVLDAVARLLAGHEIGDGSVSRAIRERHARPARDLLEAMQHGILQVTLVPCAAMTAAACGPYVSLLSHLAVAHSAARVRHPNGAPLGWPLAPSGDGWL
jgi:hypothetical protein